MKSVKKKNIITIAIIYVVKNVKMIVFVLIVVTLKENLKTRKVL